MAQTPSCSVFISFPAIRAITAVLNKATVRIDKKLYLPHASLTSHLEKQVLNGKITVSVLAVAIARGAQQTRPTLKSTWPLLHFLFLLTGEVNGRKSGSVVMPVRHITFHLVNSIFFFCLCVS